ncbi:unnamed protein product [Cyprideis torosa]|uniref:NFU1 iron-sulfur cluster scaffold homolog, mitochondrial n=1 Tax=Cyprideis torosa TaxID=163714 RepID=A0A7R8WP84_9CRUS|nr:unnamed protein product [Cyprideis torosa]CAG0907039.1 unnamed protein product [Cyprideis torosa]
MVAVQKTETVEWEEVANDLKIIINEFYQNANIVANEAPQNKEAYSLYAEITPNPNVMKFVANRMLYDGRLEFKKAGDADGGTIVSEIFTLPFVREVFVSDNYISVSKSEDIDWQDVSLETRSFILEALQSGKPLFGKAEAAQQAAPTAGSKTYSDIENQIKAILEEHVKPAVASDGGNIELVEFKDDSKTAVMLLQGACSGCPSSTMTLKNGIENMLKQMMPGVVENVEALNG